MFIAFRNKSCENIYLFTT